MSKSRLSQFHWLMLLIILIVGYGLRFAYIDREMRFDEAVTVYQFAAKPIPTIVGDYTWVNNHIFHSLLVHFPYHYLGKAPVFVRLPAFISGLLMIPMVFVAGSRFYNRNVGLIAAALVATYPILIEYSVNARGYMVMGFIVIWMLVLAYDLHQKDHTGKWLLLGLLAALGFFTVPVMLYAMGGIATWLLASIWLRNAGEKRVELLKNYFVSMFLGAVLTVLLYTPVLYFNWEALGTNIEYEHMRPMPWNEFIPQLGEVFSLMWEHLTWEVPFVIVATLLSLVVAGLVFHRQLENKSLPLLPFFAGWILPLLFIQRVVPFSRTWLFLVPLLLIVSAAGLIFILQWLRLQKATVHFAAILIILAFMTGYIALSNIIPDSEEWVTAPDAEEAAFMLADLLEENDQLVMMIPYNYPVLYYSEVHDLGIGGDDDATNEESVDESEESYYIYILFPRGDDERFYVESERLDELKTGGELLHEWDLAILRRTLVEPGDPDIRSGG